MKTVFAAIATIGLLTACSPTESSQDTRVPHSANQYRFVAKITTLDGKQDEIVTILSDALAQTKCLNCTVLAGNGNSNSVWVTEVWATRADHEAALASDLIKDAINRGKPMIVKMERVAETKR